jgi:hypothetical protein
MKGFRIINLNQQGAIISGGATSPSTSSTAYVTIEKNLFENLTGNAIYTNGSISNWTVTDNKIQNVTTYTSSGNFGSGFSFGQNSTGNASQLTVTNNSFSNLSWDGIQLVCNGTTSNNFIIQNNTFSNITRTGIYISSKLNNVLIQNNTITNANTSSSATEGGMKIQSLNTVTNTVISNNTVTGSYNGIYVHSNISTLVGKDIVVNNNNLSNNSNFSINNAAAAGTLTATSNYYGTTSNVCSKISGSVTYMPFNITSDVSGTGTGYNPVRNTTQNTYFCTIQSAIDAATANDVIVVPAGTYAESLNINKALSILGPNASTSPNGGSRVAEAIINLSTGTRSIYINASNITIKGFEIINSANAGAIMGGAQIQGISYNTPTNIVIEKNYMHDLSGSAILLLGAYQLTNWAWTINDNKIDRTTLGTYFGGGYGSGIKMWTGSNCSITNNVLTNIGFTGIDVGWIQNSTISVRYNYVTNFCMVKDDGGGIYTWSGNGTYTGRLVQNNIVINAQGAAAGLAGTAAGVGGQQQGLQTHQQGQTV